MRATTGLDPSFSLTPAIDHICRLLEVADSESDIREAIAMGVGELALAGATTTDELCRRFLKGTTFSAPDLGFLNRRDSAPRAMTNIMRGKFTHRILGSSSARRISQAVRTFHQRRL